MSAMVLAVLLALVADDPKPAVMPPTPDQQFREMRDAHQAAFDAFVKASTDARTEAEQAKVLDHPGRRPRDFVPGFMALARKHPGTAAAEDCYLWVCTHTFQTADCEEAKRILATQYVESAKLGPALGFQGHYGDPFGGSETFFREVYAKNPGREIKGLACYWLARHLTDEAAAIRGVKAKPDYGRVGGYNMYAEVYGKDWPERLARLDAEPIAKEAATLFERVAKFYADVPHNDKRRDPGTLGEAAESYLREHQVLAVGKPAPEFEGDDLEGRRFRLKDYRGKVVLLDFGSHFYCGNCREMYPAMRTLTKRWEGRPFAVVSINSEPEKTTKELKDAWAEEGNTWRCLFDGNWEGPIQKAWNIQHFPTLYIVDAKGMIRHKNLVGKGLDEEIEKLIAEAEAAK